MIHMLSETPTNKFSNCGLQTVMQTTVKPLPLCPEWMVPYYVPYYVLQYQHSVKRVVAPWLEARDGYTSSKKCSHNIFYQHARLVGLYRRGCYSTLGPQRAALELSAEYLIEMNTDGHIVTTSLEAHNQGNSRSKRAKAK